MSKFQEYVTGQAFALTLSRRMCEALQFVAMDRDRQGALPNIPQLSTMHALEERGLIERNPWRLSQAGRLLYPLLAHAGLVEANAEQPGMECSIAGCPRAHYREAHKPRTVTHIPDSSGLTLPQLEAGKQALYSCSEDPSFDDVRRVIAAVAQSNPTK